MNWLTNFVRPKIRALVDKQDVPDNLWTKCPECEAMLFQRDLAGSANVCASCNFHMKIGVKERLKLLFDKGEYKRIALPKIKDDPLKFKDLKKYKDRLKDARSKTKEEDVLIVAKGKIGGRPAVVAAFDFRFMGGSSAIAACS